MFSGITNFPISISESVQLEGYTYANTISTILFSCIIIEQIGNVHYFHHFEYLNQIRYNINSFLRSCMVNGLLFHWDTTIWAPDGPTLPPWCSIPFCALVFDKTLSAISTHHWKSAVGPPDQGGHNAPSIKWLYYWISIKWSFLR